MENIELCRVDRSNYLDCFALQFKQGQERFVSHPIRSLAQAYIYYGQCTPFCIRCGGKTVGYLMVIYDDEEQTYNLWHLCIDASLQGRGYGRAAVRLAIAYAASRPFGPGDTLLLTLSPDNIAATTLYTSLGFRPTGRRDEEELEYALPLSAGAAR